MRVREPVSFWRENVIAVDCLLRALARISTSYQRLVLFISFSDRDRAYPLSIQIILLTLVKKSKRISEAFRCNCILKILEKVLSSISSYDLNPLFLGGGGGGGPSKKVFRRFGPQFGLKIRRGSPGSATKLQHF